jgi:soluble lytic murein transglycosylase-like protein
MSRILSTFLAVMLSCFFLADAARANPKIISRNGTLVIENTGTKRARKTSNSNDMLYELLAQEVQVYIFNKKTRVWPRAYGHTITLKRGLTPRDPQVNSLIAKYGQIYGVDPSLIRAVMRHESGFNPAAVSPKGAQGLMQLMPGTAALMGVRNPFDPEQNIAGGVGYLRHCLDRFHHNVPLAVAAYNAGPESVARCGTIPPYRETQDFVNNVMGSYNGTTPVTGGKAKVKTAATPAAKVAKISPEGKSPPRPRRSRPKIIEVGAFKRYTH